MDTHADRWPGRIHCIAEHLEDADLARALRLVLNAHHPDRRHGTRGQLHARADLQNAILRRPAPPRRLYLPHAQPVTERLLANRAANRAGKYAGLDTRDPQRPLVLDGAPQALLGRDRQPQLRTGDLVRRRTLRTRTPLRQVVRYPHRAVEVVALEVVAETHGREHTEHRARRVRTAKVGSAWAGGGGSLAVRVVPGAGERLRGCTDQVAPWPGGDLVAEHVEHLGRRVVLLGHPERQRERVVVALPAEPGPIGGGPPPSGGPRGHAGPGSR